MTDLEITRLCAEAMGFHAGSMASKVVAYKVSDCAIIAGNASGGESVYDPLHNDAQIAELIKHFWLCIQPPQFDDHAMWHVWRHPKPNYTALHGRLNYAVCKCVAKMQAAK